MLSLLFIVTSLYQSTLKRSEEYLAQFSFYLVGGKSIRAFLYPRFSINPPNYTEEKVSD